jgi:hypothetical protein
MTVNGLVKYSVVFINFKFIKNKPHKDLLKKLLKLEIKEINQMVNL